MGHVHEEMKEHLARYADESVRIEGFCAEPEKLLRTASVHIFPSTCEGSAKVTFEAAAAGLPQITTYESGDAVVDGETGCVIPCGDTAALAAAIERLYGSPEVCARMGAAARAADGGAVYLGSLPPAAAGGLPGGAGTVLAVKAAASSVLDLGDAVAEAADRLDAIRGAAQFFPETADVDIHGAGLDGDVVAPDLVEENLAGLDAAGALHEEGEELELGGGQDDGLALDRHGMAEAVQDQVAGAEGIGRLVAALRAADLGFDAEDEFAGAEGLGHVIVRAELQPDHAVDLLGLGRQHDDGDVAGAGVALEQAAELEAGHLRAALRRGR